MVEIVRPNSSLNDNFGLAYEINKFTNGSIFGLWKMLYSTANTEAERTMIFALISHPFHRGIEDAVLLIRAGTGPRTRRLYGSVDDFQTPEAGGQKHTLDDLLTGHSPDRVDALKFLIEGSRDEKYLSLLVEESPSLRLFLRLATAARTDCISKLRTVDVQRHIDRARQVIQTVIPNGIKDTAILKEVDPIEQFLDQHVNDVNALNAEIDNSAFGRTLPKSAIDLKALYSAESLRKRFQKFLPDAVQTREKLVTLYDNIAAPGTVDDPLLQRILPVRSAVLFLQLYGISIQLSDLVYQKVDLSTVWSTIRTAIRRIISDFDVQFAAANQVLVDVDKERRALSEMRRILKKLDLPYLPDEEHKDFAAWRQLGQIGRPEFAQFFNQNAVSELKLKLAGSNLGEQFLTYAADLQAALATMSFEVVDGFLVPTAKFRMLQRILPVRSAVLFLQLYGISIQLSDLVYQKVDLSTVWSTIRTAIRRIISDFDVQFAAANQVLVDVDKERRALSEMRRILKKLDLPYLPDEEHKDFAAWRQLGQIGRPEFAQFFNQNAVSELKLKLAGSNLGEQFLTYAADLQAALATMSFEVVDGFLVPTAKFRMPKLESRKPLSRDTLVTAVLQLYLLFYFEIWIREAVLPLGEVTDLRLFLKQVVDVRVRELAKVYLLWAKRTQHWQPADALMTAVMAGSEIFQQFETIIETWLRVQPSWPALEALSVDDREALIRGLKILASPELRLREEIAERMADERGTAEGDRRRTRALSALRDFVINFIPFDGNSVVGALTDWQTPLASEPVQKWLKAMDAAFAKDSRKDVIDPKKPETQTLEYRLRQHLRDPELQATLELEVKLVDNLRGLDYSSTLFNRKKDQELHVLFDLFIKPLLSGLQPGAKLTHQSAKRADAQGSLGRALSQLSFAGIPFLPLVTTPYFEMPDRRSVEAQICKFIANWEARNQVEILSSRWPNKDFDNFRSNLRIDDAPATLQELSLPDPEAVVKLTEQILERDAAAVRFSDEPPEYLPMFVGPLAVEMEIAFRSNWRPDAKPVDRASISAAYANDFGNDPYKWLGTVEAIPDAVLDLAKDARLKRADYIPQELLGLPTRHARGESSLQTLALAIRPYLGILRSQPQGGQMLTDLIRSQLAKGIVPDSVRAFSLVEKRQSGVVTKFINEGWNKDANKNPEAVAQLIASTYTPTSPFGFDLYLIRYRPEPRINEMIGWALWDNRSPFRSRFSDIHRYDLKTQEREEAEMFELSELLYLVTRSRHIVSRIQQRGQMLMLRGLVDALGIDGRGNVITEPARTVQVLEPREPMDDPLAYLPVPRTAYPVPRNLLDFYELFDFQPAFPYEGERLKSDLTDGTFDPNEKELPRVIMRNVPEQADAGMTRRLGQVYRRFYDAIAQYFSLRPDEPPVDGEVNVEPSFEPETPEELQQRKDEWLEKQWSLTMGKAGDPQIPLLFLPSIYGNLEDLIENPDLRRTDETGGQKSEPVEAPIPAEPALAFQTEYRLLYSLMGGL